MRTPYEEPGTPAGAGQTAKAEAQATAEQTRTAAGEVAGTMQQEAGQVARQAGAEARRVIDSTRGRLTEEARQQTGRVSDGLRQWSDELASMADSAKPDSPVRDAVHQLADGGRRAAEYLDRRGVEGVVGEVQEFARRRPGAFLLGAAAAGFLVGRMAKAAVRSSQEPDQRERREPGSEQAGDPADFKMDRGEATPTPQAVPPPGTAVPPKPPEAANPPYASPGAPPAAPPAGPGTPPASGPGVG